jgi:hypothetical protein
MGVPGSRGVLFSRSVFGLGGGPGGQPLAGRWEFGAIYLNFAGISARHALVCFRIAPRDALYAS